MGFNSVYKSLQEVFPQVDARILKAVAIEHSKDADAAVEFVISEVLPSPSFSSQPKVSLPTTSSSSTQNDNITSCSTSKSPLSPVNSQDVQQLAGHSFAGLVADEMKLSIFPYLKSLSIESKDAYENDHTGVPFNDTTCLDEPIVASSVANIHDENDCVEVVFNSKTGEWEPLARNHDNNVSMGSHQGSHSASSSISIHEEAGNTEEWKSLVRNEDINVSAGSHQGSQSASSSMIIHEEASVAGCTNDAPRPRIQDLNEHVAYDSYSSVHSDFLQDQSCLDNSELESESKIATFPPDSSAVHQEMLDIAERASKNESDSSVCEFEKPGSSSSLDNGSEQVACDSEIVDIEDKSPSATIVTRSGQICRIDLFEDAIKDAKSNKQTLFLAMETVINLMKEVELQEKAAEQAKEEASRGGLDILARVEDLRQMLQHAKEANDMHSGEVYGEKAILATEMRELQTRLISLSDERDKSLAILDEMSQSLEARLAAAEEIRKAAEKEKDEKEDFARRALAEQELIMYKVVQESKRLQVEAEENSKLREFLMDRGHLVDTLQGEIAVICKDVKLLKEKFDECVPISKSLYSSQTSCLLAASASSAKCIASDWVPEEGDSTVKSIASDWVPDAGKLSETPKRVSPASSVHDHPQNNTFEDKGIIRDDLKELSDDGWDMFDAIDAVEA